MLSTPSRFSFRKRSSSAATLPLNTEYVSSKIPGSAPPPLPSHHRNASDNRKPPRISTARYESSHSLASLESSPESSQHESPARRMRRRLSSLLTGGSPDRRHFRVPLFQGKKRSSQNSSTHEVLSMIGDESGCSSSDESDDQTTPSPHAVSPGTTLKDKHVWQDHDSIWADRQTAHSTTAIRLSAMSTMPTLDLAQQVRLVLGSTVADVDQEIEEEWEHHRACMRQMLDAPLKLVF